MAQLFVSHSSADNELAAKVKDSLADLGYESVFLDFDPTGGLVPGPGLARPAVHEPRRLRRGRLHHDAEVERQPVVPLRAGADPLAAQADPRAAGRRLRPAPAHRGPAGAEGHVRRHRPRAGPLGAHRARPRPGGALGRVPVAVPRAARLRRVVRRGVLRTRPPDRPAPPARRPAEPQPRGRDHPGARSVRQRQVLAGPGRPGAGPPGHPGLGDHRPVDAVGRAPGRDVAGAGARSQAERRRPRRGPLPGAAARARAAWPTTSASCARPDGAPPTPRCWSWWTRPRSWSR